MSLCVFLVPTALHIHETRGREVWRHSGVGSNHLCHHPFVVKPAARTSNQMQRKKNHHHLMLWVDLLGQGDWMM